MAKSVPPENTAASPEELPARMRVHALAKLLGTTSKAVLGELTALGHAVSSAQSSVERAVAERVQSALTGGAGAAEPASPEPAGSEAPTPEAPAAEPVVAAPLFMAPEPVASPPRRRRASRPAAPAEQALAPTSEPPTPPPPAPTNDEPSDGPSDGAADKTEDAPARAPRRRRSSTRAAAPVEESKHDDEAQPAADEKADKAETSEGSQGSQGSERSDDDADADDGSSRRRRRGRRGRGRGRGASGDDDHQTDSDTPDDTPDDTPGDTPADTAGHAGAEKDSDTDDSENDSDDGSGRRRRRRRRRRSPAENNDESAESGGDPPNTVVHEREPRARRNRGGGSDEVQGITGSTRLEAKRQRRRDGRDSGRRRPPILSESEFLARREAVERVMVVRDKDAHSQVAVLEDGVLVEHFVTSASSSAMLGNIYVGRVQNVLPSMEAAFIDIGRGRNGVLYAGEVDWDAAGLGGKARKIEQALHSGDPVLVQVSKDPVGHKGARLTTQISLPGRFLVYVPGGGSTGISRKLPDTERKRLKDILKRIVPADAGVIIRTASEGVSEDELAQDVQRLQAQWESVSAAAAKATEGSGRFTAAVALHEEPDLLVKVVRDLFNSDFRSLVVAGDTAVATIEAYVGQVAPDLADRVHRHSGDTDVFTAYRIDEQLAKAMDRKVWLPSGGTLVIDRTEAMTVVDVNTGKFTGAGGNLEETVTRNNIEAAEEIVRQMRLRDIGGMIVVDFIDMVLENNRDLVLRRLTECLGRDRTRHQVSEVTSLGLVQMTRKRVGAGLLEEFSTPCEHCHGSGVVVQSEPVEPTSRNDDAAESSGGRSGRNRSSNGNRSANNDRRPDAAPVVLDPGPLVHTSPPVPGPRRLVASPAPVTDDVTEVAADVPDGPEVASAGSTAAGSTAAESTAPVEATPRSRPRRASRKASAPTEVAAEPVVEVAADEAVAQEQPVAPTPAPTEATAPEVEKPKRAPRARRTATRASAPAEPASPEVTDLQPVAAELVAPEPAEPHAPAAEPATAPVRPRRRRAAGRPAGPPAKDAAAAEGAGTV